MNDGLDSQKRKWERIYGFTGVISIIAVGYPVVLMLLVAQGWIRGLYRTGHWGAGYITEVDTTSMNALKDLSHAWAIAGVVLTVFVLVAAVAKRKGVEL